MEKNPYGFKKGDIALVRADIKPEERSVHPNFVPGMEVCVGHIYKISDNPADYGGCLLRLSSEDEEAPSPSDWFWNTLWLEPVEDPVSKIEITTEAIADLL